MDNNTNATAAELLAQPADAPVTVEAAAPAEPAATNAMAAPDAMSPPQAASPSDAPAADIAMPATETAPLAENAPASTELPPADQVTDAVVAPDAVATVEEEPKEGSSSGLFGGYLAALGMDPLVATIAGSAGVAFIANQNKDDGDAPPAASGGTVSALTDQLPAEVTGPIADSPLGGPVDMVTSGIDGGVATLTAQAAGTPLEGPATQLSDALAGGAPSGLPSGLPSGGGSPLDSLPVPTDASALPFDIPGASGGGSPADSLMAGLSALPIGSSGLPAAPDLPVPLPV